MITILCIYKLLSLLLFYGSKAFLSVCAAVCNFNWRACSRAYSSAVCIFQHSIITMLASSVQVRPATVADASKVRKFVGTLNRESLVKRFGNFDLDTIM